MLQIQQISKQYKTGDLVQNALKEVSLTFRDNEFVAILGPSGSGKTTLLNIIGGLDRYDSGDLIINGISTKKYKDRDWDSYRNHTIGFVFQSYNLIPHQTILSNVELALTISGISRSERKKRATEALEKVGLGEQIHKRPNQLSGGQMQRVAIARALVNNPDILLADEPTGALDSETSVQVMDLLKEVASDRLVIMVTHNPELAEKYATRIVKLQDGAITSDTDPVADAATPAATSEHRNMGKASMSFLTALSLSFNNLRTKKGRTLLTAFAGSIGIIGIALILSLSQGTQTYISDTEKSTLSQYPLSIQSASVDTSSMLTMLMGLSETETADSEKTPTKIETTPIVSDMITSMANNRDKNDMKVIKEWLETNPDNIEDLTTDIQYLYDSTLNIFRADTSDGVVQVNPSDVMESLGFSMSGTTDAAIMSSTSVTGGSSYDVWVQAVDNEELLSQQFDVLAGKMPEGDSEVALVVNSDGTISDYTLYALGIRDKNELEEMVSDAIAEKEVEAAEVETYSFEDMLNLEFKLVPNSAMHEKNGEIWEDKSDDETFMKTAVENGSSIRVVGVLQATDDSIYSSSWGYILYRSALSQKVVEECNNSQIYAEQKANPDTDIFTGVPFSIGEEGETLTMDSLNAYMAKLPQEEAAFLQTYLQQMQSSGMSEEEILSTFQQQMEQSQDNATYEGNLTKIGAAEMDTPSSISIYPIDFEAKEEIDRIITDHNNEMAEEDREDEQVHYTDLVGSMMSSVTSIINSITYILIAFVAISLIVSSIMIGIITYISVLERTKEIGILRSIGASKQNISQVFNAETFIIGLFSGVLGIGVTLLLILPINRIIYAVTGNSAMKASLPMGAALILIGLSVVLTLIGGLIPSKKAAKKDPVLALRTE